MEFGFKKLGLSFISEPLMRAIICSYATADVVFELRKQSIALRVDGSLFKAFINKQARITSIREDEHKTTEAWKTNQQTNKHIQTKNILGVLTRNSARGLVIRGDRFIIHHFNSQQLSHTAAIASTKLRLRDHFNCSVCFLGELNQID